MMEFTGKQRAWILERSRKMYAEMRAERDEAEQRRIAMRHHKAGAEAFVLEFGPADEMDIRIALEHAALFEADPDLPRRMVAHIQCEIERYARKATHE
jgi:hypothetical protein